MIALASTTLYLYAFLDSDLFVQAAINLYFFFGEGRVDAYVSKFAFETDTEMSLRKLALGLCG